MANILQFDTPEITRLFSNLELNGKRLNHRPGSVVACTALVAGTTVGAGILGLPAVTMPSGVVPSTVLLIAVWIYTLVSGLLIAEANLNTMRQLGRPNSGMLTMSEKSLGPFGAQVTGAAYLFQHYALLVAYIAEGGQILTSAIESSFGIPNHLPAWVGTIIFTTIFGGILYFCRQSLVEKLNSAFVAILIIAFVGLLALSVTAVNPTQFLHQDWKALSPAISVMFVALFYHNIIPVITTQLEGDVQKIRQSIVVGSAIPLLMFLAWNAVILGSVSLDILPNSSNISDPLQALRQGAAGEWLAVLIAIFSEFAIATSFIGFMYGLLDFFHDVLDITPHDNSKRLSLYSLALLPAISLSSLNPKIFLTALDYVGAFSISVLGGIIPAVIIWKQRYQQKNSCSITKPLVPGGRVTLVMMMGVAIVVILEHLISISGL
ncbi:MAG: aromatic amino acid transport family protein [Nostocaceae cyanobacterium]|nr:aromatic amino acid transport family protein [Nostocaceae cyanobacterium]